MQNFCYNTSYMIYYIIVDIFICLWYNIFNMNGNMTNIIPLTKARARLGDLTEVAKGENYIVLTKGGSPKAALVDIDYLNKLQKDVRSLYQKTFIDPKLLPFTRQFSDQEIAEWQKEDTL